MIMSLSRGIASAWLPSVLSSVRELGVVSPSFRAGAEVFCSGNNDPPVGSGSAGLGGGVTLRSSQSHVAGGLWQGLQNTSIPQKHKADVLQGCTQNQSQLGKQAMVFFARQLSATLAEDGIFRTFPESETID